MIKALVVDDNKSSIELLKWMMQSHCSFITEIREANSAEQALYILQTYNPEIVFLDIQMPGGSGFDLLRGISKYNFEIIFTTAYDNYAIEAIKFSALDYLLKPIDEAEFLKAIERLQEKLKFNKSNERLYKNFIHNVGSTNESDFKLALPGINDIQYANLHNIIRIQAESNYSRLYFETDKPYLSSKTLKEFENILGNYNFIRAHKSHLINAHHIVSYDRNGFLLLKDKTRIEVSRRKKEQVLNFLQLPQQ